MELPTTMLFLMLQEISLPVALSVIIPFYFVCIFFSLMEKGCFQNIFAIVQHYLVEYIMYISITFPHSRVNSFPFRYTLGVPILEYTVMEVSFFSRTAFRRCVR